MITRDTSGSLPADPSTVGIKRIDSWTQTLQHGVLLVPPLSSHDIDHLCVVCVCLCLSISQLNECHSYTSAHSIKLRKFGKFSGHFDGGLARTLFIN